MSKPWGKDYFAQLTGDQKIGIIELARERKEQFPDHYLDCKQHKRADYRLAKSKYDKRRRRIERAVKKLCEMRGIIYE